MRLLRQNELNELLLEDLEVNDSGVSKHFQNLTLNFILNSLTRPQRLKFYQLIEKDQSEKIKIFLENNITHFRQKLLELFKSYYRKVL